MIDIAAVSTLATRATDPANSLAPLSLILLSASLISLTTHGWPHLKGARQSKLTEIEQRLRRITDNMLDMICQTDTKGSVQYSSPSYRLVLGYAPEMLSGQSFYAGLHPEDNERVLEVVQQVMQSHAAHRLEYRYRHADGHYVWLEGAINSLVEQEGVKIIWASRDISERKQAEAAEREQRILAEALRDSAAALNSTLNLDEVLERILTQVARIAPDGSAARIMLTDSRVIRFVRYKDGAERGVQAGAMEYRRAAEDTVGSRWMIETGRPLAIPDTQSYPDWGDGPEARRARPDVGAPLRSYVGAPIQVDGQVVGILSVFSTKPGAFVPTYAERLQAFADQAGIAIRNAQLFDTIRCHATDLEQRVAQRTAELEHERAQLRAILDGIAEGVIYTEDGQPRYINQALSQLTGYSAQEWVGYLNLLRSESTSEADFATLCGSIADAVKRGGLWKGEIRLRRKGGTEFDANLSSTRVARSDGQPMGIVTVIRDISQEKALQAQKARFVANASHELRTPVTNFKTRLYLLRHQPEKADEHITVLQDVSERMKRLIDDLLDASRFERGIIPLQRQDVALQSLVADVIRVQQPEADRKKITLVGQLPAAPLHVFADPDRMIQVITNLVTNAISYSPEGGRAVVRLTAEPGDASAKGYAAIHVEDTGVGISPEHLSRIFEPFFRIDGAINGTGLGLTITREIVELHGGAITVESTPGVGSRFSIRFPL